MSGGCTGSNDRVLSWDRCLLGWDLPPTDGTRLGLFKPLLPRSCAVRIWSIFRISGGGSSGAVRSLLSGGAPRDPQRGDSPALLNRPTDHAWESDAQDAAATLTLVLRPPSAQFDRPSDPTPARSFQRSRGDHARPSRPRYLSGGHHPAWRGGRIAAVAYELRGLKGIYKGQLVLASTATLREPHRHEHHE